MANPKAITPVKPLPKSDRMSRFVDEYLADFNGEAAYRRVDPGASKAACCRQAERYLSDSWVRAEIARRRVGRITILDITRERVATELARIAFFDIGKVVEKKVVVNSTGDGFVEVEMPKELCDLDEDTRRAIKEINYSPRGREVKVADKVQALSALSKMMGLHPDPNLQKVTTFERLGSDTIEVDDDDDMPFTDPEPEVLDPEPEE